MYNVYMKNITPLVERGIAWCCDVVELYICAAVILVLNLIDWTIWGWVDNTRRSADPLDNHGSWTVMHNTTNKALCDEIQATKRWLRYSRAAQCTTVLLLLLSPSITRCDLVSLMSMTVIPLCWNSVYSASESLTSQCILYDEFTTEQLKVAFSDSVTVRSLGWSINTPVFYRSTTWAHSFNVYINTPVAKAKNLLELNRQRHTCKQRNFLSFIETYNTERHEMFPTHARAWAQPCPSNVCAPYSDVRLLRLRLWK